MFNGCQQLTSLNLSSFNTSKVQYMDGMFFGCINLEILDMSNFNTSNVINMANMFLDCQKIKSLDLSNFDTSKVVNMANMFLNCLSLTTLELGNFNTSLVTDMSQMFYNCLSLISLNLNSFDTDNVVIFNDMFINLKNSLKYCANDKIKNDIISQLSTSFLKANCSELCYANSQKKYVPGKNMCINNCFNDDTYIYEYINQCYTSCPKDIYYYYDFTSCIDYIPLGYYLNDTNNRTLDKCNSKCSNCSIDSELNNLCISCNNNQSYYKKFIEENNNDLYIQCYKKEEIEFGFYLDNENKIFKPCYETCRVCTNGGNSDNNNCTGCYNNYTLIDGNCIILIETTIITEETETTQITESPETTQITEPPETTQIVVTSEMITTETTQIKEAPETTLITESPETTQMSKMNEITHIIEISETNQIIEKSEKTQITEISEITRINSYSYELNTNLKELKDIYTNLTYIYFMEKDFDYIYKIYNLNKETNKIFIILNDSKSNNSQKATSDYNYKLILENTTELNLSKINEDYFIDFYVPLKDLELANFNHSKYFSEQGYDIYNKSGNFYHEFCTPAFQGENDITLKDRKKYIYPNNVTLCEKNCDYNGVNFDNERVICSCNLNLNKS